MGAPRAIGLCQSFNGALQFQTMQWSAAEETLRESIEMFREIGAVGGEALSCQRLGVLQTAQGRLDEALTTLEDGVVAAKQALLRAHLQGRLQAAIAHNRLLAGEVEAADEALALGLALTESHGNCPLCESLLLPVAVSIRIAQGDLTAAEQYCQKLDEATARYESDVWVALAAQARGELAVAQGDIKAAIRHYQAAQSGFYAANNAYLATQCETAVRKLEG
jgi:predicted negative regulator of RcsB-dependent stress response